MKKKKWYTLYWKVQLIFNHVEYEKISECIHYVVVKLDAGDFVDTYNTGAVIDSGVQPNPTPASMTFNKYYTNIEKHQ